MLKTIALAALGAALAFAPAAAIAGTGSYGTQSYGYGPHIHTRSLTPFDRSWNANNQSKRQARAGAEWVRDHHAGFPHPF